MKSESARGSDPPEMGGIFKSDSGFATSDLSAGNACFCEACQEGGAYGKSTSHACPLSSLMPLFGSSKTPKKKLIERGAHLTVPLIGQRDCA